MRFSRSKIRTTVQDEAGLASHEQQLHRCHHLHHYHHYVANYDVFLVPAGPPSRDGDVTVYVLDMNQPNLPTLFILLLCLFVFIALSTVFHSINSPDNSPLSHSIFLVLFCLIGPFNYVSLDDSLPQPCCNHLWFTGLKTPTS